MVLHLNKHESPSSKDALCQVWLKLAHWFWRRGLLNFLNVFSLFPNYLPLEKTWRILFTHGCFVPSLVEIMAQWFWRRRFYTFINAFSEFPNYLPLEKDKALLLNKLESPSPKDALCQVWLKLAQWFWRRRFLNFVNVFWLFPNYVPLGKGGVLHLKKLESRSTNDVLCQVWLKLAQCSKNKHSSLSRLLALIDWCLWYYTNGA